MQRVRAEKLAEKYVRAVDIFNVLRTSQDESTLFLRLCDFGEPFRERGRIVRTIISVGKSQFFFAGNQVALATPDDRYFGFDTVMEHLSADLFYEEAE